MKLLTKEQEEAHYNATLKGGLLGGATGLLLGGLGVLGASRRYQFFRQLTLPLKAFLVTSSGTFSGIVMADHASRAFEQAQNPKDVQFRERQREKAEQSAAGKTFTERAMDFGRKERYKIVGASWIASMITAFALVNRNKYMTGQQKLVQARVYAQFLTVGVLVATAAFEISDRNNEEGRYETVQIVDPTDPEHKRMIEKQKPVGDSDGDPLWKEMVAAEEQRIKDREDEEKRYRDSKHKKDRKKADKSNVKQDDDGGDKGADKDGDKGGDKGSGTDKQKKQKEVPSANEAKNKEKDGGETNAKEKKKEKQ